MHTFLRTVPGAQFTMLKIKELPANERPRERLIAFGPSALSDAELLALVLRTGDYTNSALGIAQLLLKERSIKEISRSSAEALQEVSGIGIAKACQVVASFELGRRAFEHKEEERPFVRSAADAVALVALELHGLKQEHFLLVLVDTRQRFIKKERMFIGTLNGTLVHPREIFHKAIENRAAGIVVVHNHPSNDPTPSAEDERLTKQLKRAGSVLGIDVLDHVIIADNSHFSFAESGLI